MRACLPHLASWLLLATACSAPREAAFVLALNADPAVRQRIDTIEIQSQRGDRSWVGRYGLADPRFKLPGTLTFLPDDPEQVPGQPLTVKVVGLASGKEAISRVARVSFQKNQAKLLRVSLSPKCLAEVDPCKNIEGKTCDDGVCVDELIDLTTLPDFDGNEGALRPWNSGAGGQAGAAGQAGEAGQAGSSGQGGEGGQAGAAGEAGSAGQAGAGGADPCGAPAPLEILQVEATTGAVEADSPLEATVTVAGGSGTYRYQLKTEEQPGNPVATVVLGSSTAKLSALAQRCGQSYFVEVRDELCPASSPVKQPLSLSVNNGPWVIPCAQDTPLQCGSIEHPWCSIQAAQDALAQGAATGGGVTLRLAGDGVFVGTVDMRHQVHLEGGYPADFSSAVPLPPPAGPTPTIQGSDGSTESVRWLAPEDAPNPLVASLSGVRVRPPQSPGPGPVQALLVRNKAKVDLARVAAEATTLGAGDVAALAIEGNGATVRLTDCSLNGPGVVGLSATRSCGVRVEGDSVDLTLVNSDAHGGLPPSSAADGESYGLYFASQGGKLTLLASILEGAPVESPSPVGLRVTRPATLDISGATMRGGPSRGRSTGFSLEAFPLGFVFSNSTVVGTTGGLGDGVGLSLANLERPAAPLEKQPLVFSNLTAQGATGGAPALAVGVEVGCFSDPEPLPLNLASELIVQLDKAQISGATEASSPGSARGISARCDSQDPNSSTLLTLNSPFVEGGAKGIIERVGIWAQDVSVQINDGQIHGSKQVGGSKVHGIKMVGELRSPNLTATSQTPALGAITGGRGAQNQGENADVSGVTLEGTSGAGEVKIFNTTVRGCTDGGCQGEGNSYGLHVVKAVSLEVNGCDIEGGPIGVAGNGQIGTASGVTVEVGTFAVSGQLVFSNNVKIAGSTDANLQPHEATGLRIQNGPVVLQDNGDIRGGLATWTAGVFAQRLATEDSDSRDLIVKGNTIRGGSGLDSFGLWIEGFLENHVWNNRIDAGGTKPQDCAELHQSQGIHAGWLPGSYLVNNVVFGGNSCEVIACDVDTQKIPNFTFPPTNAPPDAPPLDVMLVAHNLCLAPGSGASQLLTGMNVVHQGSIGHDRTLLLVGNLLGFSPSAPNQAAFTSIVSHLSIQHTSPVMPENKLLGLGQSYVTMANPPVSKQVSYNGSGSLPQQGPTFVWLDEQELVSPQGNGLFASPNDQNPLAGPDLYDCASAGVLGAFGYDPSSQVPEVKTIVVAAGMMMKTDPTPLTTGINGQPRGSTERNPGPYVCPAN